MGTFYSKIAGVSVGDRQEYVKSLNIGENLKLVREYDNSFDQNAIAIYSSINQKLGYLPRETSKLLAYGIDEKNLFITECKVERITSKTDIYNKSDEDLQGVNIKISTISKDEIEKVNSDSRNSNNNYEKDEFDDDDDDYPGCRNYGGMYEISECYDYGPGDSAPWDSCDADPDMCCGYDH